MRCLQPQSQLIPNQTRQRASESTDLFSQQAATDRNRDQGALMREGERERSRGAESGGKKREWLTHRIAIAPDGISTAQTLFNKLAVYLGNNLVRMVDRPDDPHCFRMQKNRSVARFHLPV